MALRLPFRALFKQMGEASFLVIIQKAFPPPSELSACPFPAPCTAATSRALSSLPSHGQPSPGLHRRAPCRTRCGLASVPPPPSACPGPVPLPLQCSFSHQPCTFRSPTAYPSALPWFSQALVRPVCAHTALPYPYFTLPLQLWYVPGVGPA